MGITRIAMTTVLALGLLGCGGSNKPAANPQAAADRSAESPRSTPSRAQATEPGERVPSQRPPAQQGAIGAPGGQADRATNEARCRRAAAHIIDLVRQLAEESFANLTPAERAQARAQLERDLNQAELERECMKQPLSAAEFDCIMKSDGVQSLMQCEEQQPE